MSAATERELLDRVPVSLWIDNGGVTTGSTFPVDDPATGATLAEVAGGSVEDGLRALSAATAAGPDWASTAPRRRSELLYAAYAELRRREDDYALLMTMEMGKPLAESLGEVRYAAEYLRWFAEEAVRLPGRNVRAPGGEAQQWVVSKPVGPCLLITPWNFPLAMVTRKVAPALAAGCTVVVKPAEQTPLSALAFASLLTDVGLPSGVCNVVTTADPGPLCAALLADPRLRKLSFTGSTEVGRLLAGQAARRVLRVSLELGGNAPFLVFADADLDAAVDGAMLAKFRNGGQACTAANRFLVHESIADEFAARLADRAHALRLGRGTEDGVTLGPLIDEAGHRKVTELVEDALARGASVVGRQAEVPRGGWYYPPTVLRDIAPDSRLLREEIFGPVAPITTFGTEEEAVALANDTEYGLTAYAYTRDLGRAMRLTDQLEFGMIGLNRGLVSDPAAPFGGVKQSGYGREGGGEGINEYLALRYVSVG